jgi:predicted GIY-YIG superfamily endonuclease
MAEEIMVLQKEFQDNKDQIRVLLKRNRFITKELSKAGAKPLRKSYMEKPIMLYALLLERDFYYIGMSRNPEKRFAKHLKGKGAAWTKKHCPVKIVEIREAKTNDDSEAGLMEDQMTLEYAEKYGYDNVRGGGYCQAKPPWPSKDPIKWITVPELLTTKRAI